MASVYTKADIAIRRATDEKFGYTHDDIAQLCGVNIGSVKRWLTTGRAKADAIQPLLDIVGYSPYLSAKQVTEHLVELNRPLKANQHGKNVRRYSITRRQLGKIAGREILRAAFLQEIEEELLTYNLLFLEGVDFFVVVHKNWIFDSCAKITDEALKDFIQDIAAQIDDDDSDDAEE